MFYGNIFNKSVETKPAHQLVYESADFDLTEEFIEAVQILEENYFTIQQNHLQALHIYAKEQNEEILIEGFANDFLTSVVEFFKKMIQMVTDFVKKMVMYINSLIGNFEKFLNRYADTLYKLEPDFSISGYEYTFTDDIPNTQIFFDIVADFNRELKSIQDGKLKRSDINKLRETQLSTEFLELVRQELLKASHPLDEGAFDDELHRTFRNQNMSESTLQITSNNFKDYLQGYSKTKELHKKITKDRDTVITLLKNLQTFFKNGPHAHYVGSTKMVHGRTIEMNERKDGVKKIDEVLMVDNTANMELMASFYRFKFDISKKIGNLASQSLIEKAKAVKESLTFHQKIIRKAVMSKHGESNQGGTDK